MILHPSLASADPLRYAEVLTALHNAPLGSLHMDIEDTSFINNITFGMKTIQAVAQYTRHPLSFHLMVSSPQRWLPWLVTTRPGWIFIHAESVQYPAEILAEIRAMGAKAGLAFNPGTPLLPYRYLAPQMDALMIMTSEPDGCGQQFIAAMCDKVSQSREYFPAAACWADGGITLRAARLLAAAGAQHLVVGRALFTTSDYNVTLSQFSAV
ncbi:ribulose-phosphate 3 epimerase family protein [Salmonella bongori]|uniref:Putative epimerase LsrE n=3 Tax=Salmonella TaxID=590 RepID=A0A750KRL9_SALER|nr:ribulose-phosphate 3 epimerase family protein [Salmonella bongori]EGS1128594.1 ribulose-phosphate 3 epimerase family protein [Salmonella bongori CFSAN000509]HAC6693962.1 ribulose-phosphate 3 epimerase family protein [Salmonella bongori serovar 44:r:-]AGR58838.1 Ribulose-phosphate 3-epimerase [Salmonella bongori N268-08]AID24919.1 epimerase [Salmonella bongori serovar 48:z41:-- str. RKS3044]ECC8734251.1 epimerase [Salmonella bongori]